MGEGCIRRKCADNRMEIPSAYQTPSLLNYHLWNNRWYNFSGPVSSAAPEPNASFGSTAWGASSTTHCFAAH